MDTVANILVNGGDVVVHWVLVFLFGALATLVVKSISNATLQPILSRAVAEVRDAVLEIDQTYVSALKAANADGKLTDVEKSEALSRAIAVAKSNIGVKGLKALARIVGLDGVDKWLSNKVEATVAAKKAASPSTTPAG